MSLHKPTILVTSHGSHLYGLNHSGSDVDIFRVVGGLARPKQQLIGEIDYVQMPLDNFLANVYSGSHQSCEALFSTEKWVHPHYRAMFENIRVTGNDVFAKYRRTIRAFSYGNVKRRRHAVRLGYNLAYLRRYGRFDPRLSDNQRNAALTLPHIYRGQSLYDIATNP